MSATADPALLEDQPDLRARRRLYAFLDQLKKGDLELGAVDYARVDRVLILLAARGIRPDSPDAAAWIAPALCGSPTEQTLFHERFRQFVTPQPFTALAGPEPGALHLAKSKAELEVEKRPQHEVWLRRWLAWSFYAVLALAVLVVAAEYLPALVQSEDKAPVPVERIAPYIPPLDFSSGLLRPLAYLPILGALGILLWRRSRQLMLLRAFAPTPQKSEKVAFAAALPRFYNDAALRRSLGALRRHWPAPGATLHVRRSIHATMRAGGRPELRFGTRPRTPEYVLLVDSETARDHLAAAASLLMNRLTDERVVVTRYDYFGDPRRVAHIAESSASAQQYRLADLAGLHADATILLFTEAATLFDSRGRLFRWLAELREWGRPVLLTPRPVENWDWPERELDREGVLVVPATKGGLALFAERVKLGSDVLLLPWHQTATRPEMVSTAAGRARGPTRELQHFDLATYLEPQRDSLLDETPLPAAVTAELLADLQVALGPQRFLLLQAMAVFPRLEPALTLHLGLNLRLDQQPLLDENGLLATARLPWLRVGHMPDWLRQALVRRLDKERLEEILGLLQSFLQPVENPRTGAVSLDIGRRSGSGFRQLLLSWIERDPTGTLQDQILVDALRGRNPNELGVPVPSALANRLRSLFRTSEWVGIVFAGALALLLWLLHASAIDALATGWNAIGGPALLKALQDVAKPLLGYGWFSLIVALAAWWRAVQGSQADRARALRIPRKVPFTSGLVAAVVFAACLNGPISDRVLWSAMALGLASIFASMLISLTRDEVPDAVDQLEPLVLWREHGASAVVILLCTWMLPLALAIDYSLGDHPRWLNMASLVLGELTGCGFAWAMAFARVAARRSDGAATVRWPVPAMFAVGQPLLPLLCVGILALAPPTFPSAQDQILFWAIAYLGLRLASGIVAVVVGATPPSRTGGELNTWRLQISAAAPRIVPFRVLFAPAVLEARPHYFSPVPADFLAWMVLWFALNIQYQFGVLFLTGARLRGARHVFASLGLLAPAAGFLFFATAGRWVGDIGISFPQPLLLLLGATTFHVVSLAIISSLLPSSAQPVSDTITWSDVYTFLRKWLWEEAPWAMLPVLWGTHVTIQSAVLPWPNFSSLFVPICAWLGYRYGRAALPAVLIGGLPYVSISGLGASYGGIDIATSVAGLLVVRLASDNALLSSCLKSNTVTARNLLFVFVGLGATAAIALSKSGFFLFAAWGPYLLVNLIWFVVGLSRIRMRVIAVLALAGALSLAYGVTFNPPQPFGVPILYIGSNLTFPSQPGDWAIAFLCARGLRLTLDGRVDPRLDNRFFYPAAAVITLLMAFPLPILNASLASKYSLAALLLWAGARSGYRLVLPLMVIALIADGATVWYNKATSGFMGDVNPWLAPIRFLPLVAYGVLGKHIKDNVGINAVVESAKWEGLRREPGAYLPPHPLPLLQFRFDMIATAAAAALLAWSLWSHPPSLRGSNVPLPLPTEPSETRPPPIEQSPPIQQQAPAK